MAKGQLPAVRHPSQVAPAIDAEVTVLRERGGYAPDKLDPIISTLVANMRSGAELLQKHGPMLDAVMSRLWTDLQTYMRMSKPLDGTGLNADGTVNENATLQASVAIGALLELANQASIIMDRLSKTSLNVGKTIDDATRLRTFLATGDEDPDGLDQLSEAALRKIVVQGAKGQFDPAAPMVVE